MENVNWLSMVLATLVPMVLGFLWYSPMLFGKAWMEAIGMTEEKQRSGNMPVMMGLSILMAFLLSFFFINFNNAPGQEGDFDSFGHGAFHGVILFLIFATMYVSNALFEQRSGKAMLINLAFWLLCCIVMGGILDAMNHWPNTV